jgi:hypothetical protein
MEAGEVTDELGLCCDVVEKLQTTEWRVQFLHLGFDSSHWLRLSTIQNHGTVKIHNTLILLLLQLAHPRRDLGCDLR